METHEQCQEREWRALYAELSAQLGKRGKPGSQADGDFWIVDGNDGSSRHKVWVRQVSFLTRPLAMAVQRAIRVHSLAWDVLFSLTPDLRPTEDDQGILVRKHDILEHWNAGRMRKAFGDDFRWGNQRGA